MILAHELALRRLLAEPGTIDVGPIALVAFDQPFSVMIFVAQTNGIICRFIGRISG